MNQPLVTIVTPSFNQGPFIRQTIESVLSQDYPRIQYIIMDGGSTDETAAIAREYSSRLRFISEPDRGQSHAINKGFQMAEGEVVSWLNSDDTILPGAVTHAVRAFEQQPELGAVYGEGYLINRDGEIKCRFPATEPFNLWKLIYASDYVLQQTLYFRRAVFDRVGFLDENLHWGMDWDILIRIGKLYPMRLIAEYMGCLREYGEAKTFSGGVRRFRELARIMRRHGTMRYPPGYITYGLDTYQNVVCRAIERVTPGFLSRPSKFFQKAICYGAHRIIARTLREAQGLYSDQWATTRLHYMLPPGEGKIHLTGMLPELGPCLHGQTITICCDGEKVETAAVPIGEFQIAFDRPRQADPATAVMLDIRASKALVPKAWGMGPDSRKLCYLLRNIEWAHSRIESPVTISALTER